MTTDQKKLLNELIWAEPGRMSGTPCFKGTRVPVQSLIDYIEGNSTLEDFIADFPSVTRQQVTTFLELAKDQLIEVATS